MLGMRLLLAAYRRPHVTEEQEELKAEQMYQKTMENEDVDSKNGEIMLNKGTGAEWDVRKAIWLHHNAMKAGGVNPKRVFCTFHKDASYVERDVNKAVQLYQNALEAGDEDVSRWVGGNSEEYLVTFQNVFCYAEQEWDAASQG